MRVGAAPPLGVALGLARQVLAQTASHASQSSAYPVTPAKRAESQPSPRPVRGGTLDVRV